MHDELVKRLRDAAKMSEALAVLLPHSEGNATAKLFNEAADAIEERCQQVDKFAAEAARLHAKQPKWIPVTERLPEPNAVDKYGFAKGYLVKTDRHVMMHTARYNGEWWILWGKAEVITDTVTHWMPLPEPPKEES